MYYVYVIKSDKNNIYIGYATDVNKRLDQHNNEINKSSTLNQRWDLVYYEAYLDKEDALRRERQLKSHGNSKRFLYQRIERSLEKYSEFN